MNSRICLLLFLSLTDLYGCATSTSSSAAAKRILTPPCPDTHLTDTIGEQFVRALAGRLEAHLSDEQAFGISDAKIAVYSTAGRLLRVVATDKDGRFEFRDLSDGRYLVVTCAPGYVSLEGWVTITEDGALGPIALKTRVD